MLITGDNRLKQGGATQARKARESFEAALTFAAAENVLDERLRELIDRRITAAQALDGVTPWTDCRDLPADDDAAEASVRTAYASGSRAFLTTDDARDGHSERVLARVLTIDRDALKLGTGFGYDIYGPPVQLGRPHDWSASYARFALAGSLERLRTNVLDLWVLRHPALSVLTSEPLLALLRSVRADGTVKAVGVEFCRGAEVPIGELPLAIDVVVLGALDGSVTTRAR